MDSFKKNIEGIRHLMKDMKAEKYAIINPDLVKVDEYIKNLYIKVLCTVIQYDNDPSDMQVLFLKRIVCGMKLDDSVEEYMRKALEISKDDIQEFITIFTEQKYKYYFALDGLLLVSMGNGKGMNYEYLAELVELIEINKMDLEYISLVARSVLQQESSYYDQSKELLNERIIGVDVSPYIHNYYVGAIVHTDELIHYNAPDKSLSNGIVFESTYSAKQVIFDNMLISLEQSWSFESCEKVIFQNCTIEGDNTTIQFMSCKEIIFSNCRFENFKQRTIEINEVENIEICDCEFEECYTHYNRNTNDWQILGGVIHTNNANRTATVHLIGCCFRNCGGKNKTNYYSSAVISNCNCNVENCSFYNCWNYYNNDTIDPENNRRTLFMRGTVDVNNEVVGSALFC